MKFIIIFLSAFQYVPYFISMYKGKTQPSISRWCCFSLSLFITLIASLSIGAHSVIISCGLSLLCQILIIIMGLSLGNAFRPDYFERLTLWGVMGGVLIWVFTRDPEHSIYVNILVDTVGTLLIIKKLCAHAETESPLTWFIGTLGSGLSVWYFILDTGAGFYYLVTLFISNVAVFSLILYQKIAVYIKSDLNHSVLPED